MAGEVSLKGNMAMAFGTPIIAYPWPDSDGLNAELRATILARQGESQGIMRSNVGGWHSANDFFAWEAPGIAGFRKRAEQIAIEATRAITVVKDAARTFGFRFEGWANVTRHGGYNTVHDHPNSVWSGVYYVDGGDAPAEGQPMSGKLELVDPRTGVNMIHIENTVLHGRYVIDPLPGLMVVFPSWLKHFVHPYFGQAPRISIAFNVYAAEKR